MSCGSNYYGQLGQGNNKDTQLFKKINDLLQNISQIFCCGHHTIVKLTDGKIMGCGRNEQCSKKSRV